MRGFDYGRLRGINWLGVNRACSVHAGAPPPTIAFISDVEPWAWAVVESPGWRAATLRVHHRAEGQPSFRLADSGIIEYRRVGLGWTTDLADGLGFGNTSAYGALNLLDLLGADPVYLLGVELNTDAAGSYDSCWQPGPVAGAGWCLPHCADEINLYASPRCRVLNLTPGSAVTRWPFLDASAVLGRP